MTKRERVKKRVTKREIGQEKERERGEEPERDRER